MSSKITEESLLLVVHRGGSQLVAEGLWFFTADEEEEMEWSDVLRAA